MMKKFFLGTLVLIAFATGKTDAQVKNNLSFGPIAGVGHTSISGKLDDDGVEKKFNPSFKLGIRLVYSNHPHWGFGGDLSFRTEGAKVGSTGTDETIRFHANYLRLEPKAYYFFGQPSESFRPKISLGPSLGFFAGGKTKFYEGSELIDQGNTSEVINSFDLGLAGAAGFNYRLSTNTWLNVDMAYTHGLLDIIKENEETAIHNRSLFLNVGVLFGIGGAKK